MEDPTSKPDLKDKNTIEEPEDKHDDQYEITITDKEKREKDDEEKEDIDEKKDTEKPLIDDDSVKIDIKSGDEGTDTATLPISDKKSRDDNNAKKEKPPMYLFPITQMKLAWTRSSNVLEFLLRATCIIFSTLGWLLCVGGFPFVSVAMLIIGSLYVDDCKAEPNIPVYLIVAGVLGTIQHFMSVWTKYLPKDSQGRMQEYRSYCRAVDSVLHIFLAIWFICGCVWVYGIYDEVDYKSPEKNEYCHKTLYYFAFWILNLSFIIMMIIIVLSLCCILCIASSPKHEEIGTVQ